MRFHKFHEQRNTEELKAFVKNQSLGLLITFSGDEKTKLGLYNAHFDGTRFLIHLGRTDEQTLDLLKNKKCQFVFYETLSVIPSYWIDERYGGAINNFFKFAQFDCEGRVIEELGELQEAMQILMDHYQPEKLYDPLDVHSEVYADKFKMICAIELKVQSVRSKWNLGQTKVNKAQKNILKQLKVRNSLLDSKTAQAMESWGLEE